VEDVLASRADRQGAEQQIENFKIFGKDEGLDTTALDRLLEKLGAFTVCSFLAKSFFTTGVVDNKFRQMKTKTLRWCKSQTWMDLGEQ
jgi:hypothetical protein